MYLHIYIYVFLNSSMYMYAYVYMYMTRILENDNAQCHEYDDGYDDDGDEKIICYAMLCYAMLCYAMLCYAMLCYAMLCYAMLCYAMLCYAMLCYAMLCYAMLCYAMLCYAMLCYAMLCYAMLCYAMLCYAMLRYATLCYAMLRYAMIYTRNITNIPDTTPIIGAIKSQPKPGAADSASLRVPKQFRWEPQDREPEEQRYKDPDRYIPIMFLLCTCGALFQGPRSTTGPLGGRYPNARYAGFSIQNHNCGFGQISSFYFGTGTLRACELAPVPEIAENYEGTVL